MKQKMFDMARRLSKKSPSKFKLGCVISNKNHVISVGFNNMGKTHPKIDGAWKTLHAEAHALMGLSTKETNNCTVYVYRETKDGVPAMSKPCPLCETALREAGIKKVYYSVNYSPYWEMLRLK